MQARVIFLVEQIVMNAVSGRKTYPETDFELVLQKPCEALTWTPLASAYKIDTTAHKEDSILTMKVVGDA